MHYLDIAPLRPFSDNLTYSYIEKPSIGVKVQIPLGKAKCFGFVVGYKESCPKDFNVKPILSVVNEQTYFSEKNLEFYKWVASYYHYPLGEVLSLVIPSFIPKRTRKNLFEATRILHDRALVELNYEQQKALEFLRSEKEQHKYAGKNLLHGVTGSGKTEVYIEIIKDALREGKTALVIVPEIALTPQLIERISRHFTGAVSILHSNISRSEKYYNWMDLKTGKSKLCIGARSAIFSPIQDLGVVIVDEEQDNSYKQDDRLRYNARDLAFVLAKIHKAKVILSSATPSAETYYNAVQGKYSYISLNKRVRELCMPSTILVDLRKTQMITKNLSKELVRHIEEALARKEQVILYINRRGYSSSIVCKDCATQLSCPRCSITLTEHKSKKILLCHYCAYERALPNYCNKCGSHELVSIGSGTEKVFDEVKKLFPTARVAQMDSDSIKGRTELQKLLDNINNKKVDIIVGTQIVGKGHDFPDVSLVGIVNADTNLYLPDFRASERVFHQIMQVSGRAGRMSLGKVLVQTSVPEHFSIRMAVDNNYIGFYEEELKNRKEVVYPPFINLVDIKMSSVSKEELLNKSIQYADVIRKIIDRNKLNILMLGPSPCPITMINRRHRSHILLKSKSRSELSSLISEFEKQNKRTKNLRISFDIDPYSLL